MTTKTGSDASQQRSQEPREQTSLRSRYGEIGISAVAAAARYSGDAKSQDETEAAPRIDQRFIEFAA
jgi:hypothetical protein